MVFLWRICPATRFIRRVAVCVYCASGPTHPDLLALAAELGEAIADRGWTLVWGGGNVSAMGALADAARGPAAAGPSASSPRRWCAARSPTTTPTS